MALKAALVSAAASGASVDFADSGAFGGATPKLAIFLAGDVGSADTANDGASFQLGASDGTNHAAIAMSSDTKAAVTNVGRSNVSDAAYTMVSTAGTQTAAATCAFDVNKATLSFSNQSAGETIYALLLGGDIEVSVINWSSPGGTGAKPDITHGLTAAPEIILVFGNSTASATNDSGAISPQIGAWISGTQVGYSQRLSDNAATTALSAQINTTNAIISMGATTQAYLAVIENVGATTFNINIDTSTTNRFHFVCLRSTSGTPLGLALGNISAKTTTGTQTDATGMTQNAQVVLSVLTAMTTLDGNSTSDSAGVFGLGIAVKNSGTGTWQYGSVAHGGDDGAAIGGGGVDWMNHQHSAAKHIHSLSTAGATTIAATVDSATSGNLVHNYGTASGTAVRFPFLAFGADVPATGQPASRRFGRNIFGVENVRIY